MRRLSGGALVGESITPPAGALGGGMRLPHTRRRPRTVSDLRPAVVRAAARGHRSSYGTRQAGPTTYILTPIVPMHRDISGTVLLTGLCCHVRSRRRYTEALPLPPRSPPHLPLTYS